MALISHKGFLIHYFLLSLFRKMRANGLKTAPKEGDFMAQRATLPNRIR